MQSLPWGLGLMRLSTEADRDEARGRQVLRVALEAGVGLLDTADAYALSDAERGHNEWMVAQALAEWSADRPLVATKGGLRRPKGRWVPDGRAKWLTQACTDSRDALGVEAIDLYLLHAPDPKTALATSVRALQRLLRGGLVRSVGLCNVSVAQIEQARACVEVAAVQVEFGLWNLEAIRGGVLEHCARHGLPMLAHRPFGGLAGAKRIGKHAVLQKLGDTLGVTPHQVALAYLRDVAPHVVALPGASRPEHAAEAIAASRIRLDDVDRRALDAAFPVHARLRVPRERRRPAHPPDGAEVVLVMGIPGAGKSTWAQGEALEGYTRLNRDEAGGSLRGLHREFDRLLATGNRRVLLDNTYVRRVQRGEVVEIAWEHGLPVRCVWVDAPADLALVHATRRLLELQGELLAGDDLFRAQLEHPNLVGPDVVTRYAKMLEPPVEDEGFERIDVHRPAATWAGDASRRGVVVALDGVVRSCKRGCRAPLRPEDVDIDAARAAHLGRLQAAGTALRLLVWAPEVGQGTQTEAQLTDVLDATRSAMGLEQADFGVCRHAPGPARCWCRVPLPGLGVQFMLHHGLLPRGVTMVGRGPADKTFARRLGVVYEDAAGFFGRSV